MEYVKCKECGKDTPANTIFCEHCNGYNGHQSVESNNNMNRANKLNERFKKCPNGHRNADNADACSICLADLSGEIFTLCGKCGGELLENETCTSCLAPRSKTEPHPERDASPRIYCESYPGFEVEIKDGYVIGREGNVDITALPRGNFISRKHATFLRQGNAWFIRAEATTNSTKVNFKVLEQGQTEQLKDNDRIILADTIFIFRGM